MMIKNQNLGRMKKLAKNLGIADQVEFLGWIPPDKIHTYYRRASVFVMPSLMEGFGLVFLEAMTQGLPVIGGNIGGTPEVIHNEENGILTSPENSVSLQNAILKLLNDRNIREKIIQNGYRTSEKFSVKIQVHETNKYYQGVLLTQPHVE